MNGIYPDEKAAKIAEDTVERLLDADYRAKENMSEYSTELVRDKVEGLYSGLDQLKVVRSMTWR